MSKRDLQRIEVLTEVLAGRRTTESAAGVLNVSLRQTQRLLARYEDGGGAALIHKSRGRPATNTFNVGVRDYVLELLRQNYRDFGPTLASEALLERHSVEVSRETLRKWMVEAGLWLSRKQRRTFHQPRLRRESYGELVQIVGSQHRWFEGRGEPCTLLVFIDDATSKLMQLRFVPSESTSSYFEALQGYLQSHGCPVAFYSDKHSVVRMNRDAAGGQGMTQFGRALAELNIEILCAKSSQAKGRVEREQNVAGPAGEGAEACRDQERGSGQRLPPCVHGALQGTLRGDASEARQPASHGPLADPAADRHPLPSRAALPQCAAQLPLRPPADHLERNKTSEELAGKYIDLYDYTDGTLEVRWKGISLPYRVFAKDQRVRQTAVVENKRLGHALSLVRAQQDSKPDVKVLTNSEKDGYKKRPRHVYGPGHIESSRHVRRSPRAKR